MTRNVKVTKQEIICNWFPFRLALTKTFQFIEEGDQFDVIEQTKFLHQ